MEMRNRPDFVPLTRKEELQEQRSALRMKLQGLRDEAKMIEEEVLKITDELRDIVDAEQMTI